MNITKMQRTELVECKDAVDFLESLDVEVDLVYLDPPYMTQRTYRDFEDKFSDMEEYTEFLREIVVLVYPLMKKSSSLFLQCSTMNAAYIQYMMDQIFGPKGLKNIIIWQRNEASITDGKFIPGVTETILYYVKSRGKHTHNPIYLPNKELDWTKRYKTSEGRTYKLISLAHRKDGCNGFHYVYNGATPINGWVVPEKEMNRLKENGDLHLTKGLVYRKHYVEDANGSHITNLWTGIFKPKKKGNSLYATSKPLPLIERIIKLASNEGDIVLDCFLGGGATAVACRKLNRSFSGCDNNPDAITETKRRLNELDRKLL